jgi:hypothetical protein
MSSPGEIIGLAAELERCGVWLRYSPSEDKLYHSPVSRVSSALAERICANRDALVRMLIEDEDLRRTGVLQSERQVFEEFRDVDQGRRKDDAA